MKLTSLDLHNYSICPNQYFNLNQDRIIKPSPARDTMKRIVLSKALGRESKWTIKGIASVWDNIFWKDKQPSQDNINTSVKGSLSLKKLYNRLPDVYDAYSSKNLVASCEAGLYLYSVSDFITLSERGVEIWVYYKTTPKQMRKSILGAAELYILRSSLRKSFLGEEGIALDYTNQRDVFIVYYYAGADAMKPMWFRVKCSSNDKAVLSLADQIKKGVKFSNPGEQCGRCKVNC